MAGSSAGRAGHPRPSPAQLICNPLRVIVSQNRRRYTAEGFNLDLTYITDRIIAMGYPADTTEALYRNSMSHIVHFLEKYHPGHYKVFNLRGSYVYDTSKFHGRVTSFEMTDHHPPRLEYMAPFCREVHDYLEADKRNVVAVHCKAGKGRTGVMICAYLVYIGFYPSPRQNMDYYSIVRTRNNKGVTIPSQRRYVYYFNHLRKHGLNYIPLRVELIGVYVEKPPRIGSALAKGALSLRVANGDVDVFVGDDIWFTTEMNDAETSAWADGAVAHGPDQYDPYCPEEGKDCVSRRCYGWEVPRDKRVFIQGDVRVDVFSKTKVKIIGVPAEKKKIGHVWVNTSFACPMFCGCVYIHGDELYPYPPGGTTIAASLPPPVEKKNSKKKGSSSVPSSPPLPTKGAQGNRGSGSVSSSRSTMRTPSFDTRKKPRTGLQHGGSQEAATRLSEPQVNGNGSARVSEEENVQLLPPPGLDRHCPSESLQAIYSGDRVAPRIGIEKMLKDAHRNHLISDLYNSRRLSIPSQGPLVALAPPTFDGGDPLLRGKTGGPRALYRAPDEHVQFYGALEVDRAFKNKDVDVGFKIILVMRCVPDTEQDKRLADSFIRVTAEQQEAKDRVKREKIDARQRKLINHNAATTAAEEASNAREEPAVVEVREEESKSETDEDEDEEEDESDAGGDAAPESARTSGTSSGIVATSSAPTMPSIEEDPRRKDPDLKKYFYRQRSDSTSTYPAEHHKCPLLYPHIKRKPHVCSDRPQPSAVFAEEAEVDEGEGRGEGEERPARLEWRWSDSTVDAVRLYHPGAKRASCSASSHSSEGEVGRGSSSAGAATS